MDKPKFGEAAKLGKELEGLYKVLASERVLGDADYHKTMERIKEIQARLRDLRAQ